MVKYGYNVSMSLESAEKLINAIKAYDKEMATKIETGMKAGYDKNGKDNVLTAEVIVELDEALIEKIAKLLIGIQPIFEMIIGTFNHGHITTSMKMTGADDVVVVQ